MGNGSGLGIAHEHTDGIHVLHANVMNVIVLHRVVFDDHPFVGRMVVVAEYVAHLDRRGRDIVKVTPRDHVLLRTILQVDARATQTREGAAMETDVLGRMADHVGRTF